MYAKSNRMSLETSLLGESYNFVLAVLSLPLSSLVVN